MLDFDSRALSLPIRDRSSQAGVDGYGVRHGSAIHPRSLAAFAIDGKEFALFRSPVLSLVCDGDGAVGYDEGRTTMDRIPKLVRLGILIDVLLFVSAMNMAAVSV